MLSLIFVSETNNMKNGFHLNFDIEGDKAISRRLRIAGAGFKDFRKPFNKTGKYLRDFIKGDVFETRGRTIGETWKPLNKKYASWKSQHYPGKGILEATGKMKSGFKYKAGRQEVVIGNIVDYFRYHQSNKSRSKLPRRVMLKLNEDNKQRIVKLFHEDIRTKLRKK